MSDAMVTLISSYADNKDALGRRYGEWAVSAPTVEAAVAAAAMAQDELGHARATYPVLAKLGHPRAEDGLRQAGLYAGAALTVVIGLVLSSTTSTIIVFAQELVPHRFGMISGVFFGVAFGIGGLGAAVLGKLADHTSIEFVYQVCAYLPAIGLLAVFLPKLPRHAR